MGRNAQRQLENHFYQEVNKTVHDFMTGAPNNDLRAAIQDMQREKAHSDHYPQYRNAVSHFLAQKGLYPDLTLVDVQNNQLVFMDRRDRHLLAINDRGVARNLANAPVGDRNQAVPRIMPGADRNDQPTDVTRFPQGDGQRPGYLTADGKKIIVRDLAEIRQYGDGTTVGVNKLGQIVYSTDINGKDREFAYDRNGQVIAMKGYSNSRWENLNGQWTCTAGNPNGLKVSRIQVMANGSAVFDGEHQGQTKRWIQTRSGQLMFDR